MAEKAKLFKNGGSQAVRLPRSCRFSDEDEAVLVHRVGRKVILEPLDEWPAEFLACLGGWSEEIAPCVREVVGSSPVPGGAV